MFGVTTTDTFEIFQHVFRSLERHNLVYLSITEPVWGIMQQGPPHRDSMLNALLPFVPKQTAVLLTGGYEADSADEAITTNRAKLIAFGRPFITNPDLVERMRNKLPLNDYSNQTGFYGGDENYYTTHKTWAETNSETYLASLKVAELKL